MDKEKEIQEMAQTICKAYNHNKLACAEEKLTHCGKGACVNSSTVKILYTAGYRKADEVRKETAKEIALKINSMQDTVSASEVWVLLDILEMLKKKYGVDVEE